MIALPTDPEAAADALIAAFASRSPRGELLLPALLPDELSESELEAQPCIVMQAGSPTYGGLPLSGAPQALMERFAAKEFARVVTNADAFDVARIRATKAPWLNGHFVLLPHRENKIEVPFFADDQIIGLAGRTNAWIYEMMRKSSSPQLDDNLITFIRLFFATVVGQLGAFRLVDRTEHATWLPNASTDAKQEFAAKLSPLRMVGKAEDGRLAMRGTVLFKNALFVTSVMVAPDWTAEVTDEELLIEDLPIAFGQQVDLLVRY